MAKTRKADRIAAQMDALGVKPQAAIAFDEERAECEALLKGIEAALKRQTELAAASPRDWGYVGNLTFAKGLLRQAERFLAGHPDEEA